MTRHAVERARHAMHAAFFGFGFLMALFGVHVPSIRAHYRLDDGTLAIALLGVAVGAVLCLALAGRVIAAFGVRRVAATAAGVMGVALVLLLRFESFAALLATMVALGAAVGLFDVAINTEGSFIETALERKVMSLMHGMWSLGGMTGAASGSWMLERAIAPAAQLQTAAAVVVALAWAAAAGMLPTYAAPDGSGASGSTRWRAMPARTRGALLLLGLLAVLGLLAEGAIYDWSVLFLQRERGAEPALAALGFAAFSGAMALGRFGGDTLRARMPAPRLLAASAALAAGAMTVVLLVHDMRMALAGLALVGLGLSNVIPILFVSASRIEGASPAAGIAVVSSLGWVGVVLGPPLVGGVAQASSLTAGLALVVVASVTLAGSARQMSIGVAVTAPRRAHPV